MRGRIAQLAEIGEAGISHDSYVTIKDKLYVYISRAGLKSGSGKVVSGP